MIGLLAAVLLSQGLSPNAPGVTGGGKVLASFPLVTSGPLITEDANTVAHVYWNGTALVDTKGNAWTQNGTVPQVTANPFTTARVGAGPFSTSNWYSLAGLAQAGDFSVCAVFNPGALGATQMIVAKDDGTARQFAFFVSTTGTVGLQVGTSSPVTTATTATVGGPNVACAAYTKVGAGTSTGAAQLNLGTVGTATNMAVVGAATSDATIGRRVFATAEGPFTGTIYEVIVWSRALSQAEMLLIQQRVFGHYDGSAPLVVARSTSGTYAPRSAEPYTLFTAAPGVARITDQGLLVEPARTNYALRNTAIDPVTYGAIWATSNLTAAAPTITYGTADVMAPDGTQTATKAVFPAVAANQVSNLYQLFTGTAAAWSGDFWIRTASGTATVYAWFAANTGSVLAGSYATCDVTTTWTRCGPQNVTLSAASYLLRVGYDARAASGNTPTGAGGTVYVWGATAEIGSYRTSTIVVAGTATARNADQVSATVPAVPAKWCVAVTAKPEEGRAWGTGTEVVWSLGSGATNNAMLQNQYFQVLDAAGKYKYTGPTAFGTTAHRMIGCSNAGALALSIDGTLVTTTTDNGGTGAMATPPTTLYFGGLGASLYFGGYLKNLKICSAKNAKECK